MTILFPRTGVPDAYDASHSAAQGAWQGRQRDVTPSSPERLQILSWANAGLPAWPSGWGTTPAYVGQCRVLADDDPVAAGPGSNCNRSEWRAGSGQTAQPGSTLTKIGDEMWLTFACYLPSTGFIYNAGSNWNHIMQWHGMDGPITVGPILSCSVNDAEAGPPQFQSWHWGGATNATRVSTSFNIAPFKYGWSRFLYHIIWGATAASATTDVWVDDFSSTTPTASGNGGNCFSHPDYDDSQYLKQGWYSNNIGTRNQLHYFARLAVTQTKAEAVSAANGGGTVPAISITTTSLASGTTGDPYSQTVTRSGGSSPFTWSIVSGSLPPGLSLAASTGVISGTPTTAGTYTFTIQVADSGALSAQRQLSIVISTVSSLVTITTTSLPQAGQNQAYSQTLAATGGTPPYTWAIEAGAPSGEDYYLTTTEIADIVTSRSNVNTPWVDVAADLIEARATTFLTHSANVADPNATYLARTGTCTGTTRAWHTCLYMPGRTDGHKARELALRYRLSGGTNYGDKARDFCLAWATGYNPLPPQSQIGHYVAEPLGPVILLCWAFMLCRDRFSAAQVTTFRNWASLFVPRGQNQCDHGVDDTVDPFWGATDTIGTETQRSNAWGNNTSWQRCMAIVAAAAVGGATLTAALDWNWNHTTAGGRNNGWSTFISNHIASTGETFEGRRRQSLGYGNWSIWAGAIIADIALHAGFHTDLFNFVTPSGNSLLQPWLFYGPAIAGGSWPYTATDTFMDSASQATIRTHYRAAAELALRRVAAGPIKTQLQTIVAVGGSTARGQNSEDHLTHEQALTSEAINLGGAGGTLPPGLSLAPSTGVISGTATTLGTYPFTARVTDAIGGNDLQSLSIEVVTDAPPPPPPPSGTLPTTLPVLEAGKVRYGFADPLGATMRAMSANVKRLSGPIPVFAAFVADKIWVGIGGAIAGTQVFTADLYSADGGAGEAGTLRIETAEVSKVGPFAAGWQEIAVPNVTVTAGDYWGGIHSGASAHVLDYAASAITGALRYGNDTYPGASNPAGALTSADFEMSFVIEGTPVSVPPPGDIDPPVFINAFVNGATLEVEFSENLATPAPATSAFTILVNSAPATVSNATIAGAALTLTLATAVVAFDVVTFDYTKPVTNPLRDAAGNEVPNLSLPDEVSNLTPPPPGDTTPPAILSSEINGVTLTIVFNETLSTPGPAPNTFSVTIAGAPQTPLTAEISGATLVLTLGTGALQGQTVTWTWNDNGTNPIRDLSGNQLFSISSGATNVTPSSDTTPPTVSSVSVNGAILTANFNEALATPPPAGSAFSVSLNGVAQTPTSPSISGNVLTLTLPTAAQNGQAVLWSYTAPASDKLRDAVGNNVASFANQAVTNATPGPPPGDTTPPVIQTTEINGATLTATFNESLSTPAPAVGTFVVTIAGTPQTPATASISGSTLTLTLATAATQGQATTWSWTDSGSNPIRDLAGNALASFSGAAVSNVTPATDTTPPTVNSVSLNGATLTATFTELLATPEPAASAFSVSLAGTAQTPTSPAISGNVLTLTLSPAAQAGQTTLWSYTQPGADKLRDLAGNNVVNIVNQTVANVTPGAPQAQPGRSLRSFPGENEFPVTRP